MTIYPDEREIKAPNCASACEFLESQHSAMHVYTEVSATALNGAYSQGRAYRFADSAPSINGINLFLQQL